MISRFIECRNGNIAIMVGITIFVLMLAAGMGVDVQRAGAAKTLMQESADAGLLYAVRLKMENPNMTVEDMEDAAREFFDANVNSKIDVDLPQFNITFNESTGAYELDMQGVTENALLGAVGYDQAQANILSAVNLGKPPYLEIVMALDNTGSMNDNGKIDDLKDAATSMVNTLMAPGFEDVYFGLVPFAQYVNVGAGMEGASWLSDPGGAFDGCVGSRGYPFNTQDGAYATNRVPAVNGEPCPDEILPLTDNKQDILDAIDGMDADGWTYIPAGLAWGWRALTPGAPLTQGVDSGDLENQQGYKALILMTDGENTKSPDYPTHNNENIILANNLTDELCDGVKAEEIIVYTIAFDVSDQTVKFLLEDCATTPSHYFDAENAAELDAAFESIATSLRNISLSQ